MSSPKLEMVSVDSLHHDPANVRDHDARNIAAIKASLTKFGQQKPIVVGANNVVIAGNGQLTAAKALGWKTISIQRSSLVGAEAIAFAIADNRTAELASWNDSDLAQQLAALQIDGEALELATGFTESEIEALVCNTKEIDEDDVPEPPEETITNPGDLWLLGDHRLLCGDSTSALDVAKLMDGRRADLMATDPPYGVNYANDDRPNPGVAKPRVAKPRVANDNLTDQKLYGFLSSCFKAACDLALNRDAAWYLWHAHLTQGFFAAAAAADAADVVLHRQIIWVKPVLLLGRGHYHCKHEPCFMGWVRGSQPPDYGEGNGERTQTTVWEIGSVTQSERLEFDHATPKPVGLFTIPIIKHTKVGEICYEPFSGSGPQIIAAEQLGRKCYSMEIEPRYCDVIVARWEKFTGNKATLA